MSGSNLVFLLIVNCVPYFVVFFALFFALQYLCDDYYETYGVPLIRDDPDTVSASYMHIHSWSNGLCACPW